MSLSDFFLLLSRGLCESASWKKILIIRVCVCGDYVCAVCDVCVPFEKNEIKEEAVHLVKVICK